MSYDLVLPRPEFDKVDRLVRAVLFNSGGRKEVPSLRTATSSRTWLKRDALDYLDKYENDCFGVCFQDGAQFDLWMNPAFVDPTKVKYLDTLLHEMCHGYFKVYEHNHRWKRLFGRTLHHYASLIAPLDPEKLVLTMLTRYTRLGPNETPESYQLRIEMEAMSIAKVAVGELSEVSRMFTNLEDRG